MATVPKRSRDAGFDLDLKYGEGREDALYHVFTDAKVEVKSDRKAQRTGNVFIEYEYRGRPSGIAATTADWWALEVGLDRWVLIRTEALRDLARQAIRDGRSKYGGDHYRTQGALVPLKALLEASAAG